MFAILPIWQLLARFKHLSREHKESQALNDRFVLERLHPSEDFALKLEAFCFKMRAFIGHVLTVKIVVYAMEVNCKTTVFASLWLHETDISFVILTAHALPP